MAIRALNPLLAFIAFLLSIRFVLAGGARKGPELGLVEESTSALRWWKGSGATKLFKVVKVRMRTEFQSKFTALAGPSSIGGAMAVECAARRLFSLSWSGGQLGVGRPQPRRPSRDPCPVL